MSKCIGCGIPIQSHDEGLPGYVPEIIVLENGEAVYCKRCHDIRHHNKRYDSQSLDVTYYDKIKVIQKKHTLVLLIIDVLDIYGGFIPHLSQYIGHNPVMILVNKIDILPKSVKLQHIQERVKSIAQDESIHLLDVIMLSAQNEKQVASVITKLQKLKYPPHRSYQRVKPNFEDIYVVGCASVGKSTFLNTFGALTKQIQPNQITTSDQFQTTLDFIKIPFMENTFIIDTPGIVHPSSFGAYLEYDSMKILQPKKYLKPKTYQLNPGQTILMGGLVQIDVLGKAMVSLSMFVSNDLYIHRTKTERVQNLLLTQRFQLFVPPFTEDEFNRLGQVKTWAINIEKSAETEAVCAYDIIISGIGFIHVVGNRIHLDITLPEVIRLFCVPSFL